MAGSLWDTHAITAIQRLSSIWKSASYWLHSTRIKTEQKLIKGKISLPHPSTGVALCQLAQERCFQRPALYYTAGQIRADLERWHKPRVGTSHWLTVHIWTSRKQWSDSVFLRRHNKPLYKGCSYFFPNEGTYMVYRCLHTSVGVGRGKHLLKVANGLKATINNKHPIHSGNMWIQADSVCTWFWALFWVSWWSVKKLLPL